MVSRVSRAHSFDRVQLGLRGLIVASCVVGLVYLLAAHPITSRALGVPVDESSIRQGDQAPQVAPLPIPTPSSALPKPKSAPVVPVLKPDQHVRPVPLPRPVSAATPSAAQLSVAYPASSVQQALPTAGASSSPLDGRVSDDVTAWTARALILALLGLLIRNQLGGQSEPLRRSRVAALRSLPLLLLLAITLTGCASGGDASAQSSQPPAEYLSNALDWIETHAVLRDRTDWEETRREALSQAPDPRTTADAYPALRLALRRLQDLNGFLIEPGPLDRGPAGPGLNALYPEGTVVGVYAGGPAERAGVRVGDVVESLDDGPLQRYLATWFVDWGEGPTYRLQLRRAGQDGPITVTFDKATFEMRGSPTGRRLAVGRAGVGYVDLPMDPYSREYPSLAQRVMRDADQTPVCGWIIDLRLNVGGDLWTYLAAVGPMLGEGDVGGFVYPGGDREPWTYRDGKVLWNGQERVESFVDGPIYRLKRPMPPVALLTSRATAAAGELLAVAFQGRPKTRLFGEPTAGFPYLQYWTPLSDGARINLSGAYSMDRAGRIYDGPIAPDQPVAIDWTKLGTDDDPLVRAAVDWLETQPECAVQGKPAALLAREDRRP